MGRIDEAQAVIEQLGKSKKINIEEMKVQTKRAFKSYFCHQKIIKKQKGALNFLQPEVKMCRGFYIPYFKINVPSFCWPLFFEEYLNP